MVIPRDSFMVMDVENSRTFADRLYSSDYESCLDAVRELKNSVIGSNKQKGYVILLGVVPRLLQILLDCSEVELLIETAYALDSLAKGTNDHIMSLIDAGSINILLRGLNHCHPQFVEACVRCLRSIVLCKQTPLDTLYSDPTTIPRLIQMTTESSVVLQECVMTIFSCSCRIKNHQHVLCNHGIVDTVSAMLCSPHAKVQMPTLKFLAHLCYQNESIARTIMSASYDGKPMLDILCDLMSRQRVCEMQLAAAKCMTYICRSGALPADDPRVLHKALPTLIRSCHVYMPHKLKVEAAEVLAFLTEVDLDLQRISSISEHLIPTLSFYVRDKSKDKEREKDKKLYLPPPSTLVWVNCLDKKDINDAYEVFEPTHIVTASAQTEKAIQEDQEVREAVFKAFSSLAANDEEIRKKIIETLDNMDSIVKGLSDPSDGVRLASVRCLHSLSRSVQQLRTTFQDHTVWRPLMKLLHNADDDILTVASSTLCNLLLEFSPSKEWFSTQPILESGAVELLCELTRREETALRLNGVWALMNMAFQADQKIKSQILTTLGSDQIFHLLSDPDVNVLMKTLGLLRNLLSTKPHIDHIMGLHSKQVMQAVILILEGDHKADVKEQALCILANIADGDFAKTFIMSNEDVLRKLATYMMHSNVKLQIAATFCISNLIWKEDEGAIERQNKLKELGIQQLLQQMIATTDTTLFDKVKTALQQFPTQGS